MRTGIGALVFTALLAAPALGQDDLRGEIEALKKGQEEIKKQLDDLEKLIKARPSGGGRPAIDIEGKVFEVGGNPIKGADSAKLTLVEFTDYQ